MNAKLTTKIYRNLPVVLTLFFTSGVFAQQTEPTPNIVKTTSSTKKTPSFWDTRKGYFEWTGRGRSFSGAHPGKFEETRDIGDGPTIRNVKLIFGSKETPYMLYVNAGELLERDRHVNVEAERIGKFKIRFLYNEVPHFFGQGRTFHTYAGNGLLTVDPGVRALLQAAPNAGASGSTVGTALPALVSQLEQSSTKAINLRTHFFQADFKESYRVSDHLEVFLDLRAIARNGFRPRPVGTFARENVGPNGDGINEALGVELTEPVSNHTASFTVGFEYTRSNWRFSAEYFLSLFRNNIPYLTWENPFRVTDSLANGPTYGVGRNRFVRAQNALAPDTNYQSFRVHASFDLANQTQVRGMFAWGRGTQNEAFLPYTLNSAMVSANLLAGQPPLFTTPLPQSSLNGVVHTIDQDYAVASRGIRNMRFLLQYRWNSRRNKSPQIVFPALPAFGDSMERRAVDFYNLPIENIPTSYTKQDLTGTWEWQITRRLNSEAEYEWEIWNRTLRDVDRTNEHSIREELTYKYQIHEKKLPEGASPSTKGKLRTEITLRGRYLYGDREPRFYVTQPFTFNPTLNGGSWVVTASTVFLRDVALEFNLMRRFDESQRTRHDAMGSIEVSWPNKLNFSIDYRYLSDEYEHKQMYGLKYGKQATLNAELNYFARDNIFFFANYSREQSHNGYSGLGSLIVGSSLNVTACCAQFPLVNTFERNSRINFDQFQAGFNWSSKGEKMVVVASYGLGFAKDRTNTFNPLGPVLANSFRTAQAYAYPVVINRQQELNLSVTRRINTHIDAGVVYRYEPYRLNDFYTDNLSPYQAQLPVTSATPGITGLVPVPRYIFLDTRYATSHANMATVFMRYTF